VIVPDANLLLYAYDKSSAQHTPALKWLESALAGTELVGLPWQTVLAFLRVATNSRIFAHPFAMEEAAGIAQQWIELKNVRLLVPGEGHWALLQRMLIDGRVSGPAATDAALAAIAIEYGGVLYTADRGFARFPGLRWVNPLQRP
jgi:toxin-antitoxin system PIN domain toxin